MVRGARLWNNVDDGFDAWEFLSPILIEDSVAYGNGVNRWDFPDFQGDGNGSVSFDLPFAKGQVKLQTGMMSNADFDIDGVKMIPGGKITGFNVDAGGDKDAVVNLKFTAPGTPAEVQKYFLDQFADKGVTARADPFEEHGHTRMAPCVVRAEGEPVHPSNATGARDRPRAPSGGRRRTSRRPARRTAARGPTP